MKYTTPKNTGSFLAFSEEWFQKHQRGLLWLCNAPIIKYWFRWILRVHRDIPIDKTINSLLPNCISYGRRWVDIDRVEQKTDFRAHPKFAKRIYFAFKPLWWSLHYWDAMFADWLIPRWSFGFLTLTAYPDPDPETATVDGYVKRNIVPGTWSDVRDGAGTDRFDLQTLIRVIFDAAVTTDLWDQLSRGIALFNTAGLGASAVVSAGTLSLWCQQKSDPPAWAPDINIYSSAPGSNTGLAISDYGTLGTTAFSTAKTYAGITTGAYNDFALNASGLAAIALAGVTKLGIRNANYDVANVSPTWSSNGQSLVDFSTADVAGTTEDPRLVVTYTLPVSAPRKLITGGSSQMLGGRLGSKRRLRLGSYD